eukprot:TRINITY_DN23233_c0_g1_i1.p1 TRINITY_DN23233_c0_g1~~TRINITY_DN23233_c0_g1_i1.p1  ORF type:complete len:410 (+),score=56.87 TRINITY_DN23233_c0_g1_i1:69-1298(+)
MAADVIDGDVASLMTPGDDMVGRWVHRSPVAKAWLTWLVVNGPQGPCQCKGFGPLPQMDTGRGSDGGKGPPLWEYVAHMDLFGSVASSVTYMQGLRGFLANGLFSYLLSHLMDAIADCAPGVATLLLYGLEYMEDLYGAAWVQKFLAVHLALVAHARRFPCHLGFTVLRKDFVGNMYTPNFVGLPLLMGISDDVLPCHADAPKVFVYDLADKWKPRPQLGCDKGLAATEVWVHKHLLQSSCRVERAEEADLLYVPFYVRCVDAKKFGTLEKGYSWEHPFASATEQYLELISELPYWSARPKDHIFLFPEEHYPTAPEVFGQAGPLGKSLVLSPEAWPLNCSEELIQQTGHACVHMQPRDRTIIIPSFVDGWRSAYLKRYNLPYERRTWLASFMGLGVKKGQCRLTVQGR